MFVFTPVSIAAGYCHAGKFDLYRVLTTGIIGGAVFPPAALLALYPVSERARALLGAEAVKASLMIAGGFAVFRILYALFKK